MRVIRAEAMGMCFGVKDALELIEGIERPQEVTIHGELVHNAVVQRSLVQLGFQQFGEEERDLCEPVTEVVLITAHGVSEKARARFEAQGKRIIDTTCPLVTRAHRAARALQSQGYFVVIIGKPGHVEVRGIAEDLAEFVIVEEPEEVAAYPWRHIGIVCQTTTPTRVVQDIHAAIVRMNPQAEEVRLVDTVCRPTKQRQSALERLIDQVEAVVVVGGRRSNNTRALVERCRERGVTAYHIEAAADLDPRWFLGVKVVGLTAGTSTLDSTVDEVERRLMSITGEYTRAAYRQTPGSAPLTARQTR